MTVLLEKAPSTTLLPEHLSRTESDHTDTSGAFEVADDNFYDLQDHPVFEHALAESNVDIRDVNVHSNPDYWRCFANFAHRFRQIEESKPDSDRSQLMATELFAAAPIFGYFSKKLGNRRELARHEYTEARDFVVSYNDQLREFAGKHLDVSRDELAKQVRDYANVLVKIPNHGKADAIGSTVRGIQYEIGFEQLLESAGIKFERGSEEDDKKGIDYRVLHDGKWIPMDVKASLDEVAQAAGGYSKQPFALKNGKAIVYSLLTDRDFEDRTFRLSPDAAAERSEYLEDMLSNISRQVR